PIGSAPQLRQKVFKISSRNRFETVVTFLRNRLFKKGEGADGGGGGGHVFCYVNSVFAPGLDEGVGGLWRIGMVPPTPRLCMVTPTKNPSSMNMATTSD
ncbi:MAG: hypothetical protein L6R39_004949, partial [Caloplaca ligustica]